MTLTTIMSNKAFYEAFKKKEKNTLKCLIAFALSIKLKLLENNFYERHPVSIFPKDIKRLFTIGTF